MVIHGIRDRRRCRSKEEDLAVSESTKTLVSESSSQFDRLGDMMERLQRSVDALGQSMSKQTSSMQELQETVAGQNLALEASSR